MPYTFGNVILQALENEGRTRLARQQQAESVREFSMNYELAQQRQALEAENLDVSKGNLALGQRQAGIAESRNTELQREFNVEHKVVSDSELGSLFEAAGLHLPVATNAPPQAAPVVGGGLNNPTNMMVSGITKKYSGVDSSKTTSDGTLAQFPSTELALTAATEQLQRPLYQSKTVDAAMKTWSNGGYGEEVLPASLRGRSMSSLSDPEIEQVVTSIAQRETGYKPGRTPSAQLPASVDAASVPSLSMSIDDALKLVSTRIGYEEAQSRIASTNANAALARENARYIADERQAGLADRNKGGAILKADAAIANALYGENGSSSGVDPSHFAEDNGLFASFGKGVKAIAGAGWGFAGGEKAANAEHNAKIGELSGYLNQVEGVTSAIVKNVQNGLPITENAQGLLTEYRAKLATLSQTKVSAAFKDKIASQLEKIDSLLSSYTQRLRGIKEQAYDKSYFGNTGKLQSAQDMQNR